MNQQNVTNTPMTPPPPLLLTMDFHDESMMLNEGILDALGRPKQVQIMLNKDSKRLLLRPCEVDSTEAVVMPSGPVLQAEVGGRSLLKKIRKIAGWQAERARICIGEVIPAYNAVCFELENAISVSLPDENGLNTDTSPVDGKSKPAGRKKAASKKKAQDEKHKADIGEPPDGKRASPDEDGS